MEERKVEEGGRTSSRSVLSIDFN